MTNNEFGIIVDVRKELRDELRKERIEGRRIYCEWYFDRECRHKLGEYIKYCPMTENNFKTCPDYMKKIDLSKKLYNDRQIYYATDLFRLAVGIILGVLLHNHLFILLVIYLFAIPFSYIMNMKMM